MSNYTYSILFVKKFIIVLGINSQIFKSLFEIDLGYIWYKKRRARSLDNPSPVKMSK